MARVYTSCNCRYCRGWSPSKIKGEHKKEAHRELRRTTKRAIRNRDEDDDVVIPQSVSTGYKS